MKPLDTFYDNALGSAAGKGEPKIFDTILAVLFKIIFGLTFRLKVRGGAAARARAGGFIVAGNHHSYLDPIFAMMALRPRSARFISKEEFLRIPVVRRGAALVGVFPVKRGATDMKVVKRATAMLKRGEVVGIFPEGTRGRGDRDGNGDGSNDNNSSNVNDAGNADAASGGSSNNNSSNADAASGGNGNDAASGGNERKLHEGIALMAHLAKADVIPFKLFNTEKICPPGARLFRLPRIGITFGEPLSLNDPAYENLEKAEKFERFTADVMAAVYGLPSPFA
jgi:1-acyl-sn-glycerol-3-phosphate acyltransferase